MHFAHGLSIGALLIFTSSLAFTRQEQTLAEQQFKNIKSFKGKQASDVIPSMEFMSASLKVSCDYCHSQDRSSDEKPEKNTAREMIAMQNDINAKNFGGRLQVTCATCHAGHTHPLNVPPVVGIETRARRTSDVTPAQILTAYTKAEGDTGSTHPILGLSLQGVSTSMGEKSNVEEWHSAGKFMVVTHGRKGDQKIGFNGDAAWFGSPNGPVTIPSQYATQFLNQQTLLTGPGSLPKLENPSAGTSRIDNRDMLVLTGVIENSKNRASIYFDKTTGLPARLVYTYPTILGNIEQINDYADYRKVGGVPLPMTVAHHSSEEDTVIHFASVHPNPKLDPKIFDPSK